MRGLLPLLLLLLGLFALVSRPPLPPGPVLGYWLDADGRVTEFRLGPDGAAYPYPGRPLWP